MTAPLTTVSKLYVLLCGYEILRKSDSTRGRDVRLVFASPITAYLLETRAGLLLIDTGVNAAIVRDPGLREQYYTGRGWTPPIVYREHELLHQFEQIGVRARDVSRILLTHMHMDHTGNLRYFRHATIGVQRREYDYAFSGSHGPAWFEIDYALPGMQWELQDGDWQVQPGLRGIATFGHTPGHQSFLVELPDTGPVVIVGDAGDLAENFTDELLPGETSDEAEALASIRRINSVVKVRGARRFIGHDPAFVHSARLAPECYS
jgi:N-acyl homoserine lactone hydrolase